jgi:hypothetical protein
VDENLQHVDKTSRLTGFRVGLVFISARSQRRRHPNTYTWRESYVFRHCVISSIRWTGLGGWLDNYLTFGSLIAGGLPITSSGTVLSLEPGGGSVVIVESKTVDIGALIGDAISAGTSSEGSVASTGQVEGGGTGSTGNDSSLGGIETGSKTNLNLAPPSSETAERAKHNRAYGRLKVSY